MGRKFISNVKGVGVKSIIKEYYASTSSSEPIGGVWVDNVPMLTESLYLWSRWKVTLTNGETTITAAVQEGVAGADLSNLANAVDELGLTVGNLDEAVGNLDEALKKQAEDVEKQFDDLGAVAEEDIVPIEKGGHGQTSAEAALLALGGASLIKLWGNPSPISNFGAQMLEFEGKYDALIFTAGFSASYIRAANMVMVDLDADNTNALLSVMWETNVARLVDITKTETGISIDFKNGSQYSSYGGSRKEGSSYCIPLAIFGVKGIKNTAE